jgi:hypothetical protein
MNEHVPRMPVTDGATVTAHAPVPIPWLLEPRDQSSMRHACVNGKRLIRKEIFPEPH